MKKFSAVLLVVWLVLTPTKAWANIPVPGGFGFLAPFWLSWKTLGLVFTGIVLLEMGIASFYGKLSWRQSFNLIIIANLFPSTLGMFFSFNMSIFIIIFPCLWLFRKSFSEKWKKGYWASVIGFFIAFGTLAFSYKLALESSTWAVFGSLIPAFFVTVLLEYPFWIYQIGYIK